MNNSGVNTILLVVILLVIVAAGAYWYTTYGPGAPKEEQNGLQINLTGASEQ
ncbi:MAG: hypothetical protein HYS26_02000 [Candidatus Kaiserbacteria bacterium]|nr:MAG: hypothetical protein HYS26_02000 [Candidatus Kaiserbacteria bacterium]